MVLVWQKINVLNHVTTQLWTPLATGCAHRTPLLVDTTVQILYSCCLREGVCLLLPIFILPARGTWTLADPALTPSPADKDSTVGYVGGNVGLWKVFWSKDAWETDQLPPDVTWERNKTCIMHRKGDSVCPWDNAQLKENVFLMSTYLLYVVPGQELRFTLISLARSPGLKARHLQQHPLSFPESLW